MRMSSIRARLKAALPDGVIALTRLVRTPAYWKLQAQDWRELARFVRSPGRAALLWQSIKASQLVACPHREAEVLKFVDCVLQLPADLEGCVVEAGCYKGGSTAKISLACRRVGRELVVFDSFEGLPDSEETEVDTLYGATRDFSAGAYAGAVGEVQSNVVRLGAPEVCSYVKGWFDQTMLDFDRPIAAAFLDVDLSTSTRTCFQYLWPLLSPGGFVYTHDGHLPPVLKVLTDREWWNDVVGQEPPPFVGMGRTKVVWAQK